MYETRKGTELRLRFIEFALGIIKVTKNLPRNQESTIIISQIIRSSTSIGANYTEALYALTKADFIHCLNIAKKESGETLYWLELLERLYPRLSKDLKNSSQECESILRILISSVKTAQNKKS